MKVKTYKFLSNSTCFFLLQICFIVLMIYRENCFIAALYDVQKMEQKKAELLVEKKQCMHQLQQIQSLPAIRAYAVNKLQLQPLKLAAVRRIDDSSVT